MSAPPSCVFSLQGQRALITGAGRGIGRAIAIGMAEAGAGVALVSRTHTELESTASAILHAPSSMSPVTVSTHPVDLGVLQSLPGLVAEVQTAHGEVPDIVVHAAGVQSRADALRTEDEDWERVMKINLTAPWRLSVEVARAQELSRSPGSHIFVASMLALTARPQVSPYIASKSGTLGVIRALSTEWAPKGIRVNGIGPGYIATELTRPLFDDALWRTRTLERLPAGRFGEAEDIVGPAVFLASRASQYMTGQLLVVDGGWTTN